ncbi:hypothetical protein [Cryptosporangium phraense]|uniref:Tetratricopeptide repeat protein n=1 Tax=Cryptosporangium phraense TaxID=2593070 RepID=A0A545AVM1_9ACTN|nr:hypothetical protein [Cryptosporangium phraense]TQS45388.1 hypothetical protein FL583_09915 [Cryptosporangium phraense]
MWKTRRNLAAHRHRATAAAAYADGRLVDAATSARAALAHTERAAGPHSPAAAVDARTLAAVLAELDRRAEANALYQRALGIFGRDTYDGAVCLHGLALLHADTEPSVSRARLQHALQVKRAVLGGLHPEVAAILEDMAALSALATA